MINVNVGVRDWYEMEELILLLLFIALNSSELQDQGFKLQLWSHCDP